MTRVFPPVHPVERSIPAPVALLEAVRARGAKSCTRDELEAALGVVMRRYRTLSRDVTARDVLNYAMSQGMVVQQGDKLVIHA